MTGARVRIVREGQPPGPWARHLDTIVGEGTVSLLVAVEAKDGTMRLATWPVVGTQIEIDGQFMEVELE